VWSAKQTVSRSSTPGGLQPAAQVLFNFRLAGAGMLPADSLAGHVACKSMKIEHDLQPLFAGHPPVAFDLAMEDSFRVQGIDVPEVRGGNAGSLRPEPRAVKLLDRLGVLPCL
jgi:hypothetical protein